MHPAIVKLGSLIHEGKLGTVESIISKRLSYNLGRNPIWEMAPHDLYIIQHLFGDANFDILSNTGTNTRANIQLKHRNIDVNLEYNTFYPTKIRQLTIYGSDKIAYLDDTKPFQEKLKLITINNFGEIESLKLDEYNTLEGICRSFRRL